MHLLKFLTITFLIFGFLLTGKLIVFSQVSEPTIILTWQALSYAPPDFQGKVLPTANSPIAASVEVFDKITGKLIDLSDKEIRWYVDNTLIESPPGRQRLIFRAPSILPKTIKLSVEIPNLEGSFASELIRIPVVPPEAVIESPFYDNQFSTSSITLKSGLYFWNELDPSKLEYEWSVNGKIAEKSEPLNVLNVNISPGTYSGYPLTIGLKVSNPQNSEEKIFSSLRLIFRK